VLASHVAGGWCALMFLFLWVDGLLRHAVVRVRHHKHHALVCGGGWCVADTIVFGVRWCIVGCLGWHMVVVPGLAAGGCRGVWWLVVVWVCCVRTG